jgi:hypothetical protein
LEGSSFPPSSVSPVGTSCNEPLWFELI